MEISEQEYKSFFDGVEFRDVVIPSTGELCQMPLVGKKATQMLSFHTASRSKVLDLLPVASMAPIQMEDGRTIIGLIAIEYSERNIEPYNEVIVVIPVRIGENRPVPTIEDLLAEDMGGCTLLVRHIAVNTRLAEIVGNELLGYAKFIAEIDFIDLPDERICVFAEGGREIFRFSVGVSNEFGPYARNTLSVCTYKGEMAYQLTYQSQNRYTINGPDRTALVIGDHPLGVLLRELDIAAKPLLARYSPDFQLISDDRNLEIYKL